MKIAIVTINQPSLDSASKLVEYLKDFDTTVYTKDGLSHNLSNVKLYNKLDDILPSAWHSYDAIICILAMGAVVRKIAPLLQDKSTDPAVIVINLALDKIVPLLSGHLGGANELSSILTDRLPNAQNFISTATDQTNTLAFDMLAKQNGWKIKNLKELASISNALLNKQSIKVATYPSVFEKIANKKYLQLVDITKHQNAQVVISPIIKSHKLTLCPKVSLGIGCNRDTPYDTIKEAVFLLLKKYDLSLDDVYTLASFEAKSDEAGLLEFASKHNLEIKFYTKEDINSLEDEFSHSASTKFFGLKGVAEPSSVLASRYKELVVKKEVYFKSVTIALAI
jgi:cobalt-precorrin 5A hydrolase